MVARLGDSAENFHLQVLVGRKLVLCVLAARCGVVNFGVARRIKVVRHLVKGIYRGVFFDIDRQSHGLGDEVGRYITDTVIVIVIVVIVDLALAGPKGMIING